MGRPVCVLYGTKRKRAGEREFFWMNGEELGVRERFVALLRRYGEALEVGDETVRAFVQPLRRSGEAGYGSFPGKYGSLPLHEFLYLGDPSVKLVEGASLIWQEKVLRVSQCREVFVAGDCVYMWAMLREVNA